MAVTWTDEQKQVIETRKRNILVSAAAGSGKTAVLVERILHRVTDPEDPADIDELLIVTFTKAAAGELRERITRALAEAHDADPDNEHLAHQVSLMPGALITTIDGFCSYVVRNYGQRIGIAPGFRVAESGEAELMKQDALKEVLEQAYADEDPEWKARMDAFIETFATGRHERLLEEAVLRTAEAAESCPDPRAWLDECMSCTNMETADDLFAAPFMQLLLEEASAEAESGWICAKKNLDLALREDGPSAYLPAAEADFALFDSLVRQIRALRAVRGADSAERADSAGTSDRSESADKSGSADVADCADPADKTAAYDSCRKLLTGFVPVRLSPKKPSAGENPELREVFKNCRSEANEIRETLLNEFFGLSLDDALFFLKASYGPIATLIELAGRFLECFAAIKASRHVLDFADLEHDALEILKRTEAAAELSARFREVMIDEYQDSNYLQEEILLAVSRNKLMGEQNYFCVGDVKQSIYSFRQARPELFMEKYERYRVRPEDGVRIDLHRNFRSRREVIDAVNGIFRLIMRKEIGGINYDDDAALIEGAGYLPAEGMETELLTVITNEKDEEGQELLEEKSSAGGARELEARAVGMRIRELMANEEIWDRSKGCMRKLRYSDIVILLRTMEGWADTYADVLESMRIPVYSTAKSGYFTAPEVMTVLHFLSIVDNPQQDIPFAAVLTSAFVSLEAEDLAEIRTADLAKSLSGSTRREDISLYEAARACAGNSQSDAARTDAGNSGTAGAVSQTDASGAHGGNSQSGAACTDAGNPEGDGRAVNPALRETLQDFFAFYDSVRARVPDTPLHELIHLILTESGFLDYTSALPGGAQRALNLRMLADKAAEYEKTSYIGLFNFIRYIENLRKYSQDFGELSTISEQDEVVRIYSIHKSKGLEYPVVFVSGLGKRFNMQDLNTDLQIHPDMGIATGYVDYRRRVKAPTLHRQAIRRRKMKDVAGEELRVLYVALTRAQQKLIMTGALADEEAVEKMFYRIPDDCDVLPASYIGKCRNCLQWILPAVRQLNERAERIGLPEVIRLRTVKPSEMVVDALETGIRRNDVLDALREVSRDRVYDPVMRKVIEDRFSYVYPYARGAEVPVEISVSELKMEAIHGAEAALKDLDEETVPGIWELPQLSEASFRDCKTLESTESGGVVSEGSGFKRAGTEGSDFKEAGFGEAVSGGAARGTAYHRVCELLDLRSLAKLEGEVLLRAVEAQIAGMKEDGRLLPEEAEYVRSRDIAAFAASPLGQRMAAADAREDLYREQPFVLGMDAAEIHDYWPLGEEVFVQGIIDAFFYEPDGRDGLKLILVDYKTDRVSGPEQLRGRYQVQLDSYAEALGRITGIPVAEKLIWSFCLGQELSL